MLPYIDMVAKFKKVVKPLIYLINKGIIKN